MSAAFTNLHASVSPRSLSHGYDAPPAAPDDVRGTPDALARAGRGAAARRGGSAAARGARGPEDKSRDGGGAGAVRAHLALRRRPAARGAGAQEGVDGGRRQARPQGLGPRRCASALPERPGSATRSPRPAGGGRACREGGGRCRERTALPAPTSSSGTTLCTPAPSPVPDRRRLRLHGGSGPPGAHSGPATALPPSPPTPESESAAAAAATAATSHPPPPTVAALATPRRHAAEPISPLYLPYISPISPRRGNGADRCAGQATRLQPLSLSLSLASPSPSPSPSA